MTDITDIFTPKRAALAPLAGVTNSVFRRICRGFDARPVMTEMVSSDGLTHGGHVERFRISINKTMNLLRFHESERPIGFQFFGSDPIIMAEAARKALELEPDFIDINAGCPVKKITAKGSGSALLLDLGLLARIVEGVVSISPVPVTVKFRSGWDNSNINAVETARICEDAGAKALIVHPRTRSQGFSGISDWTIIRAVKSAVSIPVIGSGDISTSNDAVAMLEQTGADAVMVGRRAMGNPWIFRQIMERLNGEPVSETPGVDERLELALQQLDMLASEYGERFSVFTMRKFFGWYSRGARDGASFRQRVFRAMNREEVKSIVREFQARVRECETLDRINQEMVET